MKLWLLRPAGPKTSPWEPWYDKAVGFVVRAATEDEARRLANENGGDEVGEVRNLVYRTGGDPWLDPALSSCVELASTGPSGLIIRDFKSA